MNAKNVASRVAVKARRVAAVFGGDTGILRTLKERHAELILLARQLQRAADAPNGSHTCRALFSRMQTQLLSHTHHEAHAFYALLQSYPPIRDRARRTLHQQAQLTQLVDRLSDLDCGEDGWLEVLEELIAKLEHHIEDVELRLFPEVRRVLTPEQLRDLGRRFRDARIPPYASESPPHVSELFLRPPPPSPPPR